MRAGLIIQRTEAAEQSLAAVDQVGPRGEVLDVVFAKLHHFLHTNVQRSLKHGMPVVQNAVALERVHSVIRVVGHRRAVGRLAKPTARLRCEVVAVAETAPLLDLSRCFEGLQRRSDVLRYRLHKPNLVGGEVHN